MAIARVNNPDALLVLLLVAATALAMRAVESGRTKHLAWAGALVGLAFMTKMLQGWMIVPALGAVYLLAGPPRLLTRIGQLLVAGLSMVALSAAWPLAVTLWPGSTPYIGGSTDGTVWDLILGYNGFGRLTGGSGPGGGAGFGGDAGVWRMFNEQVGGQVAWLLPLAAVSLVAGLWLTRRAPRTDLARAGWLLFGIWAAVHVAVFSFQQGIFHPYYVSALAPAVGALAGAGLVVLWRAARTSLLALAVLDATVLGSAWPAVELLGRTPDFAPALRIVVPVAAAIAVLASVALRMEGRLARRMLAVAVVTGAVALAAGPAAYSVASVGQALNGNDVTAGPASASGGGPGGMGGSGGPPSGSAPPSGATAPAASTTAPSGAAAPSASASPGGQADDELIAYLQANQGSATYLVAATGSQKTAPIIIATGEAVVTIGGFSGSDNAPTVSQLEQMVKDGELKYVLLSGDGEGRGGGPGGGASQELTSWVQEHGTEVTDVTSSSGTLYEVSA